MRFLQDSVTQMSSEMTVSVMDHYRELLRNRAFVWGTLRSAENCNCLLLTHRLIIRRNSWECYDGGRSAVLS